MPARAAQAGRPANIGPMRARKEHLDTLAICLLLVCCVFWGFQQILIKTTVAEVPPLWQASLRFIGATVLLLVWCVIRRVKLFERDGTLQGGLLAGLLFAGEFACLYLGLRDTTASRLTVLDRRCSGASHSRASNRPGIFPALQPRTDSRN